ncbi:MAG TPA: ferrochelatase [Actinomycetota bacterium]|nr:ferrochelatase [Actinomycetota bacterium]
MTRGVLVMAYGTPRDLDDVEPYYTDIRRGRPPTPEQLEELTARYAAIGGRSPLLEMTEAQAKGIAERTGVTTFIGQKHAAPFIPDAIAAMAADGVHEAVGLVLAPHFSTMSIGDYERRVEAAGAEAGWAGSVAMVRSWHLEPGYLDFLQGALEDALGRVGGPDGTTVLFTAHSLPRRILEAGDPYPDQLAETSSAVADRCGLSSWQVGWQSAGRTADPWLGPDVLEILEDLASKGARAVVVCPCGFVADHLEVLYDLDIEASARAEELGVAFARTRSPNDDPGFLDALAAVVMRRFEEG